MDPFDAKGVSLDRLRSFCAVVEHGSITAAVGDDPVRQSQYSRQIKELEQAMEVRLFERRNRRLIPTPAGRSVALLTRRYFDALLGICRESTTASQKLTIVAGESVLEGYVMPRFGRVRELYPNHVFHFQNETTSQIVQKLQRGEAEIGVVRESALNDDLASVFLTRTSYRLVVPRSLLPEGSIHGWEQLRGLPTATLRGGGEFAGTLAALADQAGLHLTIVAECSTFGGLREIIRTGGAAAFLPEWMARAMPEDRFVCLEEAAFEPLERSLYVVASHATQTVHTQLDGMMENLARVWRP